jgi:hypothetical protein
VKRSAQRGVHQAAGICPGIAFEHNLRQNDPALDRAMRPELTRCLGKDHRGGSRRVEPVTGSAFLLGTSDTLFSLTIRGGNFILL